MNAHGELLRIAIGFAIAGCTNDVTVGRLEPSRDGVDAARGDGGDGTSGCIQVRCRGPVLQCGDCIDNDGDGRVDADDPDCFGPCSDSEATFAGRQQTCENSSCFFDLDCGAGNDELCQALVPNGCDCHGCCELSGRTVFLGTTDSAGTPTCSAETAGDPVACRDCTIDTECVNPCEECETCFGNAGPASSCPVEEGCRVPRCAEGLTACSNACELSCAEGVACITGCCVDTRMPR